jgi:hypothetical protein
MLAAPDQQGVLVSDPTGTISTQQGWYPDPSGAGRLRWWDGARWTGHRHDPAAPAQPPVRVSLRNPAMPVYSASIWMIVALPLLSVFALATFDLTGFLIGVTSGLAFLDPGYVFLSVLGSAISVASIIFAFVDWRGLEADGFERPFHWAWAFLSMGLYVIGRSVVVHRQAGRGLLPIGALVLLVIVSTGVLVLKYIDAMPAMSMSLGG